MRIRTRRAFAYALVVLSCPVIAACGIRRATFELAPAAVANPSVQPVRVGVVVDKQFVPYKITFRYWSSTLFTWSLDGLPEAFVRTLNPHFRSVELLQGPRAISTGRPDLIARMAVDRMHFDGANTTVGTDKVELTMTFTLRRPDGTETFRTTVSATGSSAYSQPCAFCKPDPPEAFTRAFNEAFAQLSDALTISNVRLAWATY